MPDVPQINNGDLLAEICSILQFTYFAEGQLSDGFPMRLGARCTVHLVHLFAMHKGQQTSGQLMLAISCVLLLLCILRISRHNRA